MNNYLRELSYQAWKYAQDNTDGVSKETYSLHIEKFSELLVKDMLETVSNHVFTKDDASQVYKTLKRKYDQNAS